ncbi:MAG: hypothetical protein COB15_16180 [Flavobacteriales bacterium]|nr:MAG: hypothetical protein COB15_16180 [Flavobacteriales bacterium]
MKSVVYILLTLLFFLGLSYFNYVVAVGGPPPMGGPPCWPPSNCDIPLDGGLSFLLAAGVAYGLKKVYGKANG